MRGLLYQIEQAGPGGNAGRADADLADGVEDPPDPARVRGRLGSRAAQVDHDLRGPAGYVRSARKLRGALLEVVGQVREELLRLLVHGAGDRLRGAGAVGSHVDVARAGDGDAGRSVWVPKTYATWSDALRGAGRFHTVSGGWKAGQRGGMIFGLRA